MTTAHTPSAGPPRGPRPALEVRPAAGDYPALEIHRSARRRRSGSASAQGTSLVVRLPAGMPVAEEEVMIERLVAKMTGRVQAERLGGDDALLARANLLADRYLDGVKPRSVEWSGRMNSRLGSCSPSTGQIRISRHLATMPRYVIDYVIVHELAHLVEPGHGPGFHELLARYPDRDRAAGFLEGFTAGQLAAGIADPVTADALEPPDALEAPDDAR